MASSTNPPFMNRPDLGPSVNDGTMPIIQANTIMEDAVTPKCEGNAESDELHAELENLNLGGEKAKKGKYLSDIWLKYKIIYLFLVLKRTDNPFMLNPRSMEALLNQAFKVEDSFTNPHFVDVYTRSDYWSMCFAKMLVSYLSNGSMYICV
jgi:hypothetical protein